jgi:hypothetical protein|tara:strand:- start:1428 stop:1868 length:441 start_codon:yes stop_codon:yes gene_type:complete
MAKPKYAQGIFIPTNPQKYVGNHKPKYRSGWEFTFMQFCDKNKNVLQWASEAIIIPYMHPLTGKRTNYIPDFLVVYENKHGQQRAEIVEIKPKKQSLIESKMSAQNKLVVAVNHAKWQAANAYCKRNGLLFRVITEDDLFRNGTRK